MLGLGLLALGLRLPHYQFIPAFTDEIKDFYHSLLIAHGQERPLVYEASPYIGSFWDWLLAIALRVSGDSLYAPRTLILAVGVLTVLATYLLGRAWGGRTAGLLGAGLLATAAGHIALNSHVAWSNCVTPLFTTLGAWMLSLALRGSSSMPRTALPLAGLFWGLGLQTHPSVLALLPGAATFLLWRGRPLLRTPWPYLGAGLFVLVNLNILIYNLMTDVGSLAAGSSKIGHFSSREELSPQTYTARVSRLGVGLVQLLGGAVDQENNEARFLLDPGPWPIGLLAIGGLVWQWRRGNALPGLLLLATALLQPLFNGNYKLMFDGRYISPLLPVLFACIGPLLAEGLAWLRRGEPNQRSWAAPIWLARAGLAALVAFILLHPLLYLRSYYDQEAGLGRTNARFFQMIELLKRSRRAEDDIVVDRLLQGMMFGSGDGRVTDAVRVAMMANDLPYRFDNVSFSDLLDPNNRCRTQFIIMPIRRLVANRDIVAQLNLRAVEERPAKLPPDTNTYGAYRLDRLPDAPPTCG